MTTTLWPSVAAIVGYESEAAFSRAYKLFGGAPSRVEESMLWEVEAPEYEKVRVFMTVEDALKVALEAEEKAALFFSNAMPHLRDAGVRKLFEELHGEEIQHQQHVKNELARLPASKKVSLGDNADEPVAQQRSSLFAQKDRQRVASAAGGTPLRIRLGG